jgi:subtilase family serine protease
MFGPTEQDYQALTDFATAHGLTVTGRHPNRVLLDVQGAVADVERDLHVTMRVYQHPTEARTFYAPDVEPSLDVAVPVLHISGLSNYVVPHPKHRTGRPIGKAKPKAGSGPSGDYWGSDFRAAYIPGVTLT